MTFDVITVGEPYPNQELVAFEGVGWHSDGVQHQIVAAFDGPTPREVAGLVSDYALAFCEFDGVLFVLLNPGDGWWIECPWAPLVSDDAVYRVPHADADDGHQLVAQVIVDCRSGIVLNNRMFTLSGHATQALHDTVTRLVTGSHLHPDQFMATVADVRRRFPRTEDMLPFAFVRTRTGQ